MEYLRNVSWLCLGKRRPYTIFTPPEEIEAMESVDTPMTQNKAARHISTNAVILREVHAILVGQIWKIIILTITTTPSCGYADNKGSAFLTLKGI